MAKIPITTKGVVDSTKMLISFTNEIDSKKEIISGIVKEHVLTDEFIREFKEYITKESFSASPMLSQRIVETYSDLFDEDVYIENISKSRCAELSMIILYLDKLKEKLNDDENCLIGECIVKSINNTPKEELNDDILMELLFISDESDEKILARSTSEEVIERIILAAELRGLESLSKAAIRKLPKDVRDSMMASAGMNYSEFIKLLTESKDLGWISKMIDNVVSHEIILVSSPVKLEEILTMFNALPEPICVKAMEMSGIIKEFSSYRVLSWLIENKDFTETELSGMYPMLKKSGLHFAVKKLAERKEYLELLKLINNK